MAQNSNAPFDLAIFDLDGTLIDSKRDLIEAVHAAARKIGVPERTDEEIAGYLASGTMSLVKEALGTQERFEEAFAHFVRHYEANMFVHTRLYPDVLSTLDRLRGRTRLAIMSNKRESFCRKLAEGLGLTPYFEWIVGGDTYPVKKPDPTPLLEIAKLAGVDPARSVMIGDSPQDIQAGREAGMKTVALLRGFTAPDRMRLTQADWILDSLLAPDTWMS